MSGGQGHHHAAKRLASRLRTSPPRWTARARHEGHLLARPEPGWGEVMAPSAHPRCGTPRRRLVDQGWQRSMLTSPRLCAGPPPSFYGTWCRGTARPVRRGRVQRVLKQLRAEAMVAMWSDATSPAGSLERKGSPVNGQGRLCPARCQHAESGGSTPGRGRSEGQPKNHRRVLEVRLCAPGRTASSTSSWSERS